MATTITTKVDLDISGDIAGPRSGTRVPAWPTNGGGESAAEHAQKPSHRDALQALLAFSALHDQIRRRKALASRQSGFDSPAPISEFEPAELFVLDEVLQLVAERAVSITGSDGLAIALAENNEIVLRAAAGTICPDPGTRIDRDSAFSGACFRTAQIVICDDTETDPRVNLQSCRKLGARSMVAVPLCGRRRVIGVLEAFSSWPFAFNEIDVRNLSLLAELVLGALKPEDEDRFAQSAQVAATRLDPLKPTVVPAPPAATAPTETVSPKIATTPVAAAPPQPAPTQTAASKIAPAPAEPAAPKAAPAPIPAPAKTELSPAVSVPKISVPSVVKDAPAAAPARVDAGKPPATTAVPEIKTPVVGPTAPAEKAEKAASTGVRVSDTKVAET